MATPSTILSIVGKFDAQEVLAPSICSICLPLKSGFIFQTLSPFENKFPNPLIAQEPAASMDKNSAPMRTPSAIIKLGLLYLSTRKSYDGR